MKIHTAWLWVLCVGMTLPAHATFKCKDDKGITHYGDVPPPQCANREVIEITRDGREIGRLEAPLTPEQLKVRQAERAKQAEEQRQVGEQRQRDLALLGTYGSEREFNASRDRLLGQLNNRVEALRSRIGEIDQQIKKIEADMEFFKSSGTKSGKAKDGKDIKPREMPPKLIADMERAQTDRKLLENEIGKIDEDRKATTARFDEEKKRWQQLKGGMAPGTILDADGKVRIAPLPPPKNSAVTTKK